MPGPLVSVVVTALNEGKNIQDLLESLSVQEPPFEVLVVDAGSRDATVEIARRFEKELAGFRVVVAPGSRGHSRNMGIAAARGEYIAFIDADCIANAFWLRNLRARAAPRAVVAGRNVRIGYWAFDLGRVELERRGFDITHPSSNLLYPREALLRLGGFDARFVTAEDIDLNFRAVEEGFEVRVADHAVVYARSRESITGFLRQAFWNGYGRKQLTLKHGSLWSEYSFRRMLRAQLHLWGILRLSFAILGYMRCKLRETRRDWRGVQLPALRSVPA